MLILPPGHHKAVTSKREFSVREKRILSAFGVLMARIRQAHEGGSFLVRVSLAAAGRWIWNLGRIENDFACPLPGREDVADFLEELVVAEAGIFLA